MCTVVDFIKDNQTPSSEVSYLDRLVAGCITVGDRHEDAVVDSGICFEIFYTVGTVVCIYIIVDFLQFVGNIG